MFAKLKFVTLFLLILLLVACGGEMSIRDQHTTEYLDSKPGKPLLYPSGVNVPEQSVNYAVPELNKEQAGSKYDLDELARPPRIVPKPGKQDD